MRNVKTTVTLLGLLAAAYACKESTQTINTGKSAAVNNEPTASPDGALDANTAALIDKAVGLHAEKYPPTIAETYLFDGGAGAPSKNLIPFDVKLPLWTDGAHKQRYVYIPEGAKIGLDSATGFFKFPAGTVFVKTFSSDGSPPVPVETRVLSQKADGSWLYGTYTWSDDGTAILNEYPGNVMKDGKDWRVPSESECRLCHTSRPVLGFAPYQLNFDTAEGNMLTKLAAARLFDVPASDLQKIKPIDDPHDETLSIDRRARAYMDVNCSSCHHPDGPPVARELDMRLGAVDTHLVSKGLLVPGDAAASKMYQLLTAESGRMPFIVIRPDDFGVDLLKKYIEQHPKETDETATDTATDTATATGSATSTSTGTASDTSTGTGTGF